MPDVASFCPVCGTAVFRAVDATPAAAPAPILTAGTNDNIAGALAYLTFVPAIILLLIEPYKRSRFVRFHAFQSLFLTAACLAMAIVFWAVGTIAVLNLLLIPIALIICLGVFLLVLILIIKAYQGETFKLPVIGDLAEKQAAML